MEALVARLCEVRRRISPRTSYATSGTAATELLAYTRDPSSAQESNFLSTFKNAVMLSKEFERVNCEGKADVNNHVVIVVISSSRDREYAVSKLLELFQAKRIILGFIAGNIATDINDIVVECREKLPDLTTEGNSFNGLGLIEVYASAIDQILQRNQKLDKNAIAFNGQPSVPSRQQFKYLWSLPSKFPPNGSKINDSKIRVLQRLASKNTINPHTKSPMSMSDWDVAIDKLLGSNKDDWDIYSTIRLMTLGVNLEDSLKSISPMNKSSSESDSGNEEDGRSNFMVKMILDCIPHQLHARKIRTMLDYGCAEGAITALLGAALQLPPARAFGADIRSIPSHGFTFIHLKSEEEYVERKSFEMFPDIQNSSIDLITASMVFHHVTNIELVLLEIRRVISQFGCLVLREHYCDSPQMAAFLDITHGLYSLAWSVPVEWPHFMSEYQAFYRNRDEWTDLLRSCGFILLDPKQCSKEAHSLCYAVDSVRVKKDGTVTNVIKAYYATYVPDPTFDVASKLASVQLKFLPTSSGSTSSLPAKESSMPQKRSFEESIKSDTKLEYSKFAKKELWESKKYPGQFYYVDKDGTPKWVSVSGDICTDSISGEIYTILKLNSATVTK